MPRYRTKYALLEWISVVYVTGENQVQVWFASHLYNLLHNKILQQNFHNKIFTTKFFKKNNFFPVC